MRPSFRVVAVAVVAVVLAVAGSSAAWALWTTTGTAASSAVIGTTSAAITGTDAFTTTFSPSGRSTTAPLTLRNAGTLAGTTATSVSVVPGSSTALAEAVSVAAWPVDATTSCTADVAVGPGAVTGTWASLPSMTSRLAPGASSVWCVRSTVGDGAPAPATANVHLDLVVTVGTWSSTTVSGGFSLNTADPDPQLTCSTSQTDDNYVELSWDDPYRDADTQYRAYVDGTAVGDAQYGGWHRITIAPEQLPTATDGTIRVTVRALDAAGSPTDVVAGVGDVTRYTKSTGSPALRCGS